VIEHDAPGAVVTATVALELGATGEVTDLTVVTAVPAGRGVAVGTAVAAGTAVGVGTRAVDVADVVDGGAMLVCGLPPHATRDKTPTTKSPNVGRFTCSPP